MQSNYITFVIRLEVKQNKQQERQQGDNSLRNVTLYCIVIIGTLRSKDADVFINARTACGLDRDRRVSGGKTTLRLHARRPTRTPVER